MLNIVISDQSLLSPEYWCYVLTSTLLRECCKIFPISLLFTMVTVVSYIPITEWILKANIWDI